MLAGFRILFSPEERARWFLHISRKRWPRPLCRRFKIALSLRGWRPKDVNWPGDCSTWKRQLAKWRKSITKFVQCSLRAGGHRDEPHKSFALPRLAKSRRGGNLVDASVEALEH